MKRKIAVICGYVYFAAVIIGGVFMLLFNERPARSDIFVNRVELSEDFMLGVDISSVLSLEESGVVFRDWNGNEADLFELFAAGGANYVRVRIWNDPWYDDNNTLRGFGGGNNDAARAIEIGKRATAAGMRLLVNFHYSDFWADPSKQMAPRAWEFFNIEEKTAALYEFTYSVVAQMLEAGIDIGMVQIGNETNNGMAGVTGWENKIHLFDAGSRAVIDAERNFRIAQGESDPPRSIKIAVHKTEPENRAAFITAAQTLAAAGVVYDVFGISFYHFWHGDLDNLLLLMNTISRGFNVDVAVFETSYPFTTQDTDGHVNSWSGYDEVVDYPISVQGQAHAIRDVIATVAAVANNRGVGVFLWEPAWISVGEADAAANRTVWEAHGSGWASSWAASYCPYDAGVYHGGSSWDNQAFFDHNGNPLATLNLFNYVRTGAVARTPNAVEIIQETELTRDFDPYFTVEYILENILPQEVPAIMLNNERVMLDATWNADDVAAGLERVRTEGGVTRILINGTVNDRGAVHAAAHWLTLRPATNLVQNPGFEYTDMSMWRVNFRTPDTGYANRGTENVLSGSYGFRWWRAANSPIDFSIEQDFDRLAAGEYAFEVFITGGDAGTGSVLYIYVLTNGIETHREYTALPGWNNWNNPRIANITVNEGDRITLGASLYFPNTAGAWGTLDDFFFFPSQ
jgi:arabinogalactan endo-1,4-beta-galactosidase